MSAWAKGVLVGIVVGVVLAEIVASGTRFEAFVRVSAGDRFLLDMRLDEPVVGRVVNIPVAMLGEASFGKRSWIVATTYDFFLRLRPELAPGPGLAIQELEISVGLPGTVTATNATRIAGRAAVWETVPPEGIQLHTRAIHWVPILFVLVVGTLLGRRRRS